MRNYSLFYIVLIAVGSVWIKACREPAQRGVDAPTPVAVQVIALSPEALSVSIEAPGNVQARNRILLSAQINGFVREVKVREGAAVRKGDILLTLDSRDAENQKAAGVAALDEATAALDEARQGLQASEKMVAATKASAEFAQATLARYEKLFESRSVSPQELDEVRTRRDASQAELAAREAMLAAARDRVRQVEARITQANAQIRRTEVVLGWTVVEAPSSGRVVSRRVDPGTAIFPGSPLLEIETTGDLQVLATIPTRDSRLLRAGSEVGVRSGTDAAISVTGRISEIIPTSDPGSHSMQFRVDLPPDCGWAPGDFVKVAIPASTRQALMVPEEAVRETGQLAGVFVVDSSSRARFRLVRTAPADAGRLELLSGVEPGEKVVANPAANILDGIPVEVRP